MTSAREYWYLTRGSGAVALILLTLSMCIGVMTALRVQTPAWPRFAVASLHRTLTLLATTFVVLHVVTTVADGYAPIGLKDAIVPFASPYRPIWLGLGAVAFDLLLALVVTSYLRGRIGLRTWRAVHWAAYATWPIALVHSLGTGSDARAAWLAYLGWAALAAVALTVVWRVTAGGGHPAVRVTAAALAVAVPAALVVWDRGGPGARGWAARAGTPARLLAHNRHVVAVSATIPPTPVAPRTFTSEMQGTIARTRASHGRVDVHLVFKLAGRPGGALRIDLRGAPVDGGVSLEASGVSFVPATTRQVYLGKITALDGTIVAATVRDHGGDVLQLTASLAIDDQSGRASGTLDATTPQAAG